MRGFIPPQTQEETVFCKKVVTLCEKAEMLGIKTFSIFLDLRQKELFSSQFNKFKGLKLEFFAGHNNDGERCMACIAPAYDEINSYDYPISVLHSPIDGQTKLTHRDFLGAFMNLMIKREFIGDILVSEDEVYIFVHNTMAPVIIKDLTQVGHSFVSLEYFYDEVKYTRPVQSEKNVTVASLRLDAVVSAVLNISRSEASTLIKQGYVSVNHLNSKQTDFEIIDGDVLSIRKYGKFKLSCDGGKSRKDRIFIKYYKY